MPNRDVAYLTFVSRKSKNPGLRKSVVVEGRVRRSSGESRRRWVADRVGRRRWRPWKWMLPLPCELGKKSLNGFCVPVPAYFITTSLSLSVSMEYLSSLCYFLDWRRIQIFPTQAFAEFFLSTIFWDTDSAKWRVDNSSLLIGSFPILKIHVRHRNDNQAWRRGFCHTLIWPKNSGPKIYPLLPCP